MPDPIYDDLDPIYTNIITKDYTATFGKSITTNTTFSGNAWNLCDLSKDGRVMVAAVNNTTKIMISNNYGASFFSPTGINSTRINDIRISANGNVIVITCNPGNVFISNNRGDTFTNASILSPLLLNKAFYACSISNGGKYITVSSTSNGNVYLSNNYGNTFTEVIYPNYTFPFLSYSCISGTGKYQVLYQNQGNIYVSNNFGSTWTVAAPVIDFGPGMCMSNNGQHIYIIQYASIGKIYTSHNYGNTWNTINGSGLNTWGSIINCSYYGDTILYSKTNNGNTYISKNYGNTYSTLITVPGYSCLSMTGKYLLFPNPTSISCSVNNGSSYTTVNPAVSSTSLNNITCSANGNVIFGIYGTGNFIQELLA
jgi:hypothetical protein